jgi:tripartite-type tricarboxylate transporter receptor subunit TctC
MDSSQVRRRWLGILIGLAAGCIPPALSAQAWPTRPVRVIVPFAPGGGVDTVARLLAQRLGEQMGGSFVVDNRPGAGGVAGTTVVARAVPDGHTLLVSAPEFAINAASRRKLPFDAIRDFSFISQLTAGQFIIAAHPSVPAKSVRELIALAKAQPDRLTYGSSGSGGINHLAGALFQSMAGIRWTHVPFKGAGPATVGLIGGEIDFTIASTTGLLEPIRAGRVRAIAVTGSSRFAALPDVPTVAESGVPGYEVDGWYGFYGPAGMPRELIGRLQAETRRALFHAETAERLVRTGNTPLASPPDTFAGFIKAEIDKWTRVIAAEGITPVD